MISHLKGILTYKSSNQVVIDCNGVGYLIFVSVNTAEKLPEINSEVFLHTLLIPREDALSLYGFFSTNEREVFKLITGVSGIGPKIGLGVLSSLTVEEFQQIILASNVNSLQKLPGIGKKTAERLVLELKDKISKLNIESVNSDSGTDNLLIKDEVISALISLGYTRVIAEKSYKSAVNDTNKDHLNVETLIRKALKYAMM